MRKFKLIKEYPGSPKLNTIVEVKSDGYIHWNVNSNENNPTNYIHNSSMKQYEEFWQPVVEKDYEILSLISNSKNNEVLKNTIIDATKKYNKSEPNDFWDIHSVKRLSDGEIFTIGDKINDECYNHSLDKITLYDNKILLQHNFNTWTLCHSLKNVIKSKVPLFITEDGVDIYEGDEVTWVFSDNSGIAGTRKAEAEMYRNLKYFSTKEKAEEYILMNKPVLSLNDILKILPKYISLAETRYLELEKLAKTKIKLNKN